jgi:hypothetical protein
MAEPKVVQAAPGGYFVDLGDGSEPRLFPESVVVESGLVGPTQGMYQDPAQTAGVDPYAPVATPAQQAMQPAVAPAAAPAAPAAPAPVAPAPAPLGSQSSSLSISHSTPGYTDRRKAFGPTPAPLDLSGLQTELDESNQRVIGAYDTQAQSFEDRANAETKADEVRYGQWEVDPVTGERKLVTPGGVQQMDDMTEDHIEVRRGYDEATAEAVEQHTARINQRMATVPTEDPNHLWNSGSAFQNALGILQSALGGALAVSTGSGRNLGLEALQKEIDNDIQAQRTNIDKEWKKIAIDEKSLERYQRWRADERSAIAEEQAMRYAQLAHNIEAEASTFKSEARKAERMGLAAELAVKAEESAQKSIGAKAEMLSAESKSAFEEYKMRGDAAVQQAQIRASNAAARASDRAGKVEPTKAGRVRIGVLPMTGEEIYIPADIADTMTKEQIDALVKTGQTVSTSTRKGQELQAMAQEVGRIYSGPGAHRRPVTKKKVEQLRAAFRDLQFDEVVKRTGLTATDAATQKILEILTGTGELPSVTVGSGDWAAFSDYVARNIERDADVFGSRGVELERVTKKGEKSAEGQEIPEGARIVRRGQDLAKDARKYATAAGERAKSIESLDPFEIANVAMTKITQGKSSDDVLDGISLLSEANSRNSQGQLEHLPLAASTNVLAGGADPTTGHVTKGVTKDGAYVLGGANADSLPVIRAAIVRRLNAEPDDKKRVELNLALQDLEELLKDRPAQAPGPSYTPYGGGQGFGK